MSVTCQMVIDEMEKLAPAYLAEDWDHVGLLVGDPAQKVKNILVVLDVTLPTVLYAAEQKVDMIISHHPLFFKGLDKIRTDKNLGNILAVLLKNNIAVYAAHTNLDIAPGGVNDVLAGLVGLQDILILQVTRVEKFNKLVVFVPRPHAEPVRAAILDAGAGHIGKYSHCSFTAAGMGTFMPLAGTSPYIGRQNRLESVEEVRLETVVPASISTKVIQCLKAVHPYEEVAYDLYPLTNPVVSFGLGRTGSLKKPQSLTSFASQVKQVLQIPAVKVAGDANQPIQKVAVCGGSGAELIPAAAKAGAKVLVTGDVKYHQAQEAVSMGLSVIDAGHFATEYPVLSHVVNYLKQSAASNQWDLTVHSGGANQDIFHWYD
ncbi:gtp cyclohydrolase 1 type 2/nif3 [Lucifera butyrica]|uniref:GTP cyclohydrolase 1 type 2 homolog n=1 Tax=Lucifera butyrica TaxID=1351585 RepID=A0A498R0M3_9FIRM|nr:Nif3-like dinuclear metal center hexameric protein [Lucifera butyrica]VBB06066.1 gtp cyclohydrolase 1 type 2/nif3 [Lucifera butyrica]